MFVFLPGEFILFIKKFTFFTHFCLQLPEKMAFYAGVEVMTLTFLAVDLIMLLFWQDGIIWTFVK